MGADVVGRGPTGVVYSVSRRTGADGSSVDTSGPGGSRPNPGMARQRRMAAAGGRVAQGLGILAPQYTSDGGARGGGGGRSGRPSGPGADGNYSSLGGSGGAAVRRSPRSTGWGFTEREAAGKAAAKNLQSVPGEGPVARTGARAWGRQRRAAAEAQPHCAGSRRSLGHWRATEFLADPYGGRRPGRRR